MAYGVTVRIAGIVLFGIYLALAALNVVVMNGIE